MTWQRVNIHSDWQPDVGCQSEQQNQRGAILPTQPESWNDTATRQAIINYVSAVRRLSTWRRNSSPCSPATRRQGNTFRSGSPQGLLGSPVPMAILPGGSANLMSVELGIPKDLEKAAEVAADLASPTCQVDVCLLGEKTFLLRVGIGFTARKVEDADRDLKNRFGVLAYSIASVKALKDSKSAHYRLKLDGKLIEADGVTCLIDNAGNMGIQGFKPAKDIRIDDGLLDVLIVGVKREKRVIQHWQARQVVIEADPPQPVQVDGEMAGDTPVSAGIMPGALKVLVPKPG